MGCRVGTAGGDGAVLPKNEATQRTAEPRGQKTASRWRRVGTWIDLVSGLLGFVELTETIAMWVRTKEGAGL